VLAFVTNYIPNIGFILGVIPPALIALLDGGVGSAVAVVVVYTVINVVVQIIIQPRFTGDAVGISATAAFVSLIFWAYVLGTLGARSPSHLVPEVGAARQLGPRQLGKRVDQRLPEQGEATRHTPNRLTAGGCIELRTGSLEIAPGLLTFHRKEQSPGLARKPGDSHHLRTRQQQVSPSVGRARDPAGSRTKVSPAKQAASASRNPVRWRMVLVRPWSPDPIITDAEHRDCCAFALRHTFHTEGVS
jgi:AI-2E family transporter